MRTRRRLSPSLLAGLAILVVVAAVALAAPLFGNPVRQDLRNGLTPGGLPLGILNHGYVLGTDGLGRSMIARIASGARVSLAVAIIANATSMAVGTAVGLAAGYYGKVTETVLMRVADVSLALPATLAALVLASLMDAGITRVIVITTVLFWAYPARLLYGEVLRLRGRPFVEAAVAAGVPRRTIVRRHILPHLGPMILSYAPLNAAAAVGIEATLSYLGAGINPPAASWGNMIAEGQTSITYAPHLLIEPALSIMVTILGFLLIGEGLKRLNPELARISWLGT